MRKARLKGFGICIWDAGAERGGVGSPFVAVDRVDSSWDREGLR